MTHETAIPLPGFVPEGLENSTVPLTDTAAPTEPNDRPAEPPQQIPPGPSPQEDSQWQARLHAHETGQRQRWEQQVAAWRAEVENDPQLGGANLAASVARAQLALDRFDPDRSIGRLLEQSGYGNHPAVLRFFNRMADVLMEDSPASGQPGTALPPLEDRMYAGWSSRG